MPTVVRAFAAALAVTGTLVAGSPAGAQTQFPTRPITIVVGLSAGAAIDLVVRVLADHVAPKLGQPIVIDNVIGSNGILPGMRLAKAEPNGYTLGAYTNAIQTILPHMGQKLQFDPIKDFIPITMLGFLPSLLIVNSDLPAQTLPELIALAKKSPGKLNYGSAGFGSWQHLAMEQLKGETQMELTHVPYRSAAQAVQATATGDVNAFWTPIAVARPFMEAGKVRALALGEEQRSPELPDVPSVSEAGLKGIGYSVWSAIYAPAGTPDAVVERLRKEFTEALARPEIIKRSADFGLIVRTAHGDEFMQKVHQEGALMAATIKRPGVSPPQQ
jgi:tripartite-type tricarboxylate transporter receptor subunit TctC